MQEEKLVAFFNEDADREDLDYYWNKVQTAARRLEARGNQVLVGGLVKVSTTRLEVT